MKYLIARVKFVYNTRGIPGILLAIWRRIFFFCFYAPYNFAGHLIMKRFRKPKYPKFNFRGKTYEYLYHHHNFTWNNERTVEVPIVWEIVKSAIGRGKRVLEVGNVLSFYYPISHDVLDKYERGEGIINEDVENFRSEKKYDVIASISTMEHVGWDPPDKPDPEKIGNSLLNLKKSLAPGGEIVVTMPIGWNREMDKRLFPGNLPFDAEYFLKRVDEKNRWEEISKEAARGIFYGKPFSAANAIVIGVIIPLETTIP